MLNKELTNNIIKLKYIGDAPSNDPPNKQKKITYYCTIESMEPIIDMKNLFESIELSRIKFSSHEFIINYNIAGNTIILKCPYMIEMPASAIMKIIPIEPIKYNTIKIHYDTEKIKYNIDVIDQTRYCFYAKWLKNNMVHHNGGMLLYKIEKENNKYRIYTVRVCIVVDNEKYYLYKKHTNIWVKSGSTICLEYANSITTIEHVKAFMPYLGVVPDNYICDPISLTYVGDRIRI